MMQRARLCSSASTAVQSQQDPVVAGAHDNVVVVGAMFMSMLTNKMHSRLVACTVDANQPRPNNASMRTCPDNNMDGRQEQCAMQITYSD